MQSVWVNVSSTSQLFDFRFFFKGGELYSPPLRVEEWIGMEDEMKEVTTARTNKTKMNVDGVNIFVSKKKKNLLPFQNF